MSQTVILVEVDVTSPAGVTTTLRFSDMAIRPFPPSDADRANVLWDDRLEQPPSLRRGFFGNLITLEPEIGVGAMTLKNGDEALDAYQAHAWGALRVYRWTPGQTFAQAKQIYAGVCDLPGYDASANAASKVTVGLYDYRAEISLPLQADLYAGTNGVGGVLYEGAADGLKGQPKPLGWGTGNMVPAPQVNAALGCYQLNDGPTLAPLGTAIYDRGASAGLIEDTPQVGAAFDAATPAAGHYVVEPNRGLVKLNYTPVGILSFDCGPNPAVGQLTGQVLTAILSKAGVPGGRVDATALAVLNFGPSVGIWRNDTSSAADILAEVARSYPAALLPNRTGVWTASAFGPPAGAATHTIGADEVLDLQPDQSAPPPVGEVQVGYGRIGQTFDGSSIAPTLKGTTTQERLKTPYRYATADSATTKARYPRNWIKMEITTALAVELDAISLANTLLGMFGLRADGKPRRIWTVVVPLTDARLAVELGATVRLVYPPRSIDDNFVLIAEEPLRPLKDQVTWTLWG